MAIQEEYNVCVKLFIHVTVYRNRIIFK